MQRSLVGGALVQAAFDKAAYGCKLFCCWCAQDIEANRFWDSIGFVPLAFRAGSRGKSRVHIFWQKRIREGDAATPYWYPCETGAGAIRENRIVLPIPPGTHWQDAKPKVLPGVERSASALSAERIAGTTIEPARLPGGAPLRPRPARRPQNDPSLSAAERAERARANSRHLSGCPPGKLMLILNGRPMYVDDPKYVPPKEQPAADVKSVVRESKPARPRPRKLKNDPKHVAMARDLRDRYLEEVNSGRLLLPSNAGGAKYDVRRRIESVAMPASEIPLLAAG